MPATKRNYPHHQVTPIKRVKKDKAPAKSARQKIVAEVVREVCGFAPYERRILELLKVGSGVTFRRAYKFAKKRLGSHHRALKKRAEMQDVISEQKRRHKEEHQH
ncbi:MAG: hypothetical protein KVP17_003556 [Porospora cf. gigantea B]|uniref:uncharacterized protein n=1 Tax=Porospora cf. gigantea B TaxID=2853592 RepID=UPI003571D0B4|nr:MAG: hypothetical protein KVP17_003556 [Porospora cf. gigantea B]